MSSKKLWLYWQGPKPPYISLCHELLKLHCGDENVIIVTNKTLHKYFKDGDLNKNYHRLKHIAQRVDYIRAKLLYKYGGVWFDSDTIPLQNILDVYYAPIEKNNSVEIVTYAPAGIANFAARKKSPLMKMWIEEQEKILNNKPLKKIKWSEIGGRLLEKCYEEYNKGLHILPMKYTYQIGFRNYEMFLTNNQLNEQKLKDAVQIVLYNTMMKEPLKNVGRKKLLSSNMMLSKAFRYSFNKLEHKI